MCLAFDIIFAGGGATACVVAGRLAAADPTLKILVVESGQHSQDVPAHVQPGRNGEHFGLNATTVSIHETKPIAHLNGRTLVARCGRAVGGGSVVNAMSYVRGAASDYDSWAALGNKGWSFNELLPFIQKLETFIPVSGRPTHGYSGPLQISTGGFDSGFGRQALKVAQEYDRARPVVEDINDFKTANGYSLCHKFIDPVTGRRSDTASRYLYPHSGNSNLKIVVGHTVKRVIIEDGRAVGIEYTADKRSSPEASGEIIVANATKLVVVSAGAFGSPAILERSGIGSPSVLKRNSVDVQVDLPGVGENYQDHVNGNSVFYGSDEIETVDDIYSDPEVMAAWVKEWEENGTGKIAQTGIEVLVKVRPTTNELSSAGPAVQLRWETFFKSSPDKPMAVIVMVVVGSPLFPSQVPGRKLIIATKYMLYPESIGSVHTSSGEDVNAPLDYEFNILSKDGDVMQLTIWYKMMRELYRRLPTYRGEVAAFQPAFSPGSAAACREQDMPVPVDAPDIVYTKADHEAIAKFYRDTALLGWHALGTCAMKPREQGGVVDARLNVYGVTGLKVADLSICPTNVGNNTCSTAVLVGEKAAAIIAEDLGVKL